MAATFNSIQTNPIIASAGFTQNIDVNSPSSLSYSTAGSTGPATQQTGPGWATPNNSYSVAGLTTPAGTKLAAASWGFYLFIAAVGYFALRAMGK